MFTSISSYLWGEQNPEEQITSPPTQQHRDPSPVGGEEDWVLVGSHPAPGNLGGLSPLPPTSTPPSSAVSEQGEDEPALVEVEPLGYENTRVPVRVGHDQTLALKNLRSAQIIKQRNSGKALSSKALSRSNKTVIQGKRKENAKYNMAIKSAGLNKNLKQC